MKEVILNHYGFSNLPFGKDIAPADVFPTDGITQAAAMIELGIESEDVILISGPIGCGKSLALRNAAQQIDTNRYQPI